MRSKARELGKTLLRHTGLLEPARHARRRIQARGWLGWKPLVPADEFTASCELAIRTLRSQGHEFGDYLEFGVSRGTSMACVYGVLRRAGLSRVRLIGFDSFLGLPSEAEGQGWAPGSFASTIKATRRYLAAMGVEPDEVTLVQGWFDDTLNPETIDRLALRKASLIMIDCDIYTASRQALFFCAPLIEDQAVVIFDDWGYQADKGEIGQQEAWSEFLAAFPCFAAEPLPAYLPEARIFLVTRTASSAGAAHEDGGPRRPGHGGR